MINSIERRYQSNFCLSGCEVSAVYIERPIKCLELVFFSIFSSSVPYSEENNWVFLK